MNPTLLNPTLNYSDADGDHSFVLDSDFTSIGRSAGQDLVLHDPRISRKHAVISRENGVFQVLDQGSTHGSFVIGARIEQAALKDGDVLQLGSLVGLKLHFRSTAGKRESTEHMTIVSELLSSFHELTPAADPGHPTAGEIGKLSWLSAARLLNAGGAIGEILMTLLQLTLQITGVERGFVFLMEGDEMKLARGLNAGGHLIDEDGTVSRRAMQAAIESGSKFSIRDTLRDQAASAWDSVIPNSIRSVYCIPLRKRDMGSGKSTLLGLLYLDSQIGPGYLSEVDHQLLYTIATEAAVLLHNALLAEAEHEARRAREELAVAAKIQSGLMSIALPVLPWAALQVKMIPCLEVGGDFFNAVALDDCLCAGIADVSGKGVAAAIVAATMQGIIHAQLLSRQSLPEIAAQLNQFLFARGVGKYATLVLLKLHKDGRVEYLNCGHIAPVLVRGGQRQRLCESNTVVGLLPDVTYCSAHFTLQAGDRLLLVTDGLVEAENEAGEMLGDDGLDRIAHFTEIEDTLDHVAQFQAHNQAQDDCTALQVQYLRMN
ncbi:MAG: SpoIIE family protein phosphatase [Terracidiphilus sp.]|jgi:serine phosphatase RsbU (regulator of sigma subunit)